MYILQKTPYEIFANPLGISKNDEYWQEMKKHYKKAGTLGFPSEQYWKEIEWLMGRIKKMNMKYWPLLFDLIFENILRLQDNYENPLLPKELKIALEKLIKEVWPHKKSDEKFSRLLYGVIQPIIADLQLSIE